MKQINQFVDGLTKLVMGVSAIVVFVVTFAQVICRYVLKSPLPWSTDILRPAFTYLIFWGAAWCVRDKNHLNVDVLLNSFPPKPRQAIEIAINLVLCAFFVFIIYFGCQFAISGLSQTASYLPWPMTINYVGIPSAGVVMLYYMVRILIGQFRALGRKEA